MQQVERIGISLETNLLSGFDKAARKQGYQNRSQAISELIRKYMGQEALKNPGAQAVAVVNFVYRHSSAKLMQKLTSLQHSHLLKTICATHIHLDAHDCLEIIVLKGRLGEIKRVGENILAQKGVKLGGISLLSI